MSFFYSISCKIFCIFDYNDSTKELLGQGAGRINV